MVHPGSVELLEEGDIRVAIERVDDDVGVARLDLVDDPTKARPAKWHVFLADERDVLRGLDVFLED